MGKVFLNTLISLIFISSFPSALDFSFRRIKNVPEISSLSGIDGKTLFKNLYVFFRQGNFRAIIEAINKKYPSYDSLKGSNIANRRLNEEEVRELGVDYSSYKGYFEGRYYSEFDLKVGLWELFGEHFLYVLKNSKSTLEILKLIQCMVVAEYVAGETIHRLGREEWDQEGNMLSPIDYLLALLGFKDKSKASSVYNNYNWGEFSEEERRIALAFVFVMLEKSRVAEKLKPFLEALSNKGAKDELFEIKKVISELLTSKRSIAEELKQKVLKKFPEE